MAPPTRSKARISTDNNDPSDTAVQECFIPSSTFAYLVIPSLLVLFWFSAFRPELLPYASLGPLGDLLLYLTSNHLELLKTGFKCTIIIHLMEATMAYRLSRQSKFSKGTSIKWALQTALLGFPSFGLLLRLTKAMKEKTS